MLSIIHNLQQQTAEMQDLLLRWVAISSGSDNLSGIKQMQAAIIDLFQTLEPDITQYPAQIYPRIIPGKKAQHWQAGDVLHFQKRPAAPYQILLCGHCDTVFSMESRFQSVEMLSDSIWRGPGVSDMKGGLISLFFALRAFEQLPIAAQLGWQVCINADEELGSLGSMSLLEEFSRSAQYAFVYEPRLDTAGTLAGERKGSGNFTIVASGKTAHVGRAYHEGRNAVVALSQFVNAVASYPWDEETIVNVANIAGGDVLNRVPDSAQCQINIRVTTQGAQDTVLMVLRQLIQSISEKTAVHFSLEGNFHRPPKKIDAKTQILYDKVQNAAQTLGIPLSVKKTGGCCDGNNLAAFAVPTVDTLGVRGGKIHTEDEFIILDSLVESAQLSALLLNQLAQGR